MWPFTCSQPPRLPGTGSGGRPPQLPEDAAWHGSSILRSATGHLPQPRAPGSSGTLQMLSGAWGGDRGRPISNLIPHAGEGRPQERPEDDSPLAILIFILTGQDSQPPAGGAGRGRDHPHSLWARRLRRSLAEIPASSRLTVGPFQLGGSRGGGSRPVSSRWASRCVSHVPVSPGSGSFAVSD